MDAPTLGKPCVCYQQPDPEYRKAEGLSQSMMKELLRSPAHFRARYGPDADPFFPTAAMQVGSAVHARVLEPEIFDSQFCSREDYAGEPTISELQALLTTQGIEFKKAAKKAELLALAYPEGVPSDKRTAFGSDDWRAVMGVADALRTHDIAGMWFCPSQKRYRQHNEVSLYSKDHRGHVLKARLDRIQIEGNRLLILDLKTTDDATASAFQRKVVNLNYDLQAAWYSKLAAEAFPDLKVEFVFVAVERKAPHGIRVFRASDSVIQSGLRKMDRTLDRFSESQAINYWPSYDPVITDLAMPTWAATLEDEECLEF